MREIIIKAIVFLCILVATSHLSGQTIATNDDDFMLREKIIFADDFREDAAGVFPSRWHQAACNHFQYEARFDYRQYWKVKIEDTTHLLGIYTSELLLEPNFEKKLYLNDSFTIEFDFALDTASCAELNFYTGKNPDSCFVMYRFHVIPSGSLLENICGIKDVSVSKQPELLANYPGVYVYGIRAWHHFALSYYKKALDIFLDKYHVCSQQDCGFIPFAMAIGCIAPVKYTHFKITTGKEINPFNKLLTEKKFITHSILFDVGKSTIRPESHGYLTKLAIFLNANPSMRIEIDGHTDNDGQPSANLALSLARAEAVRKQLETMGISSKRLIAKGFGDTKPIHPNTTPQGKAENRRVEFVKL